MNFLKRAWQTVISKKGRSILLILVTSAIMLFVLAGLLIRNAANTATTNAKNSVGATLTLSANREAAFKQMQKKTTTGSDGKPTGKPSLSMSPVSLTDVKQIAALNNVASYNVTSSTSVNAKSFDAIETSSGTSIMQGGGGRGGMTTSTSTGDITVTGVSSTATATNFSDKTYKITKGRGITASDKNTNNVVIESELAKADSLSVGQTITVKKATGTKAALKLKIVGIYKASSSSSASTTQMGPGASDPSNTIYTSYTLANTIKGSKYKNTADSAVFTVSDPAKVTAVKKAGKKLIKTSKFSLSANDASYQSVKASMNNVKSFADKIVWLVAIAGTIILALIVILMIRERRYEIGVLLALGEARWKIVAQFFVEMFMILVVSIGIAGAGGQFVGNKLGAQLVAQTETTSSTTTSQTQAGPGGNGGGAPSGQAPSGSKGGFGNNNVTKQKKTELDVNVTATDLVALGGLGLGIIFISIMLASVGILRLQPRKVLID